jgi:hypothetical protein
MQRTKYEESLLASSFPAACPYCGWMWLCGQDVHERKALLHNGQLLCKGCVVPEGSVLSDWVVGKFETLSSADKDLAQRVAGLRDDELDVCDVHRIVDLMEQVND